MGRVLLMIPLLLVLIGCDSMELSDEWKPLEKIQQSRTMTLGLSDQGARTVGDTMYVRDLDQWLEDHPEPEFAAFLKHERVHAERQIAMGVTKWIAKYGTDVDFMWREEQLGWYEQLVHLRSSGLQVSFQGVAETLSEYKNLRGKMVDFDVALGWVREVWDGSWDPDSLDEEGEQDSGGW